MNGTVLRSAKPRPFAWRGDASPSIAEARRGLSLRDPAAWRSAAAQPGLAIGNPFELEEAGSPQGRGATGCSRSGCGHPLADETITRGLRERADEIRAAFAAIEPLLEELAAQQFTPAFAQQAHAALRDRLGLDLPAELLHSEWTAALDMRRLHARCVIGTFCRLVGRAFDRNLSLLSEGERAEDLIRRWGFHAVDISACADGRLSGVLDYILRIPPAVISHRKSQAGALFDLEESLRHWEAVELRRWREGLPNDAQAPTRFLKIGVYHFSSADPHHAGCAAHGSDEQRAASALLERLQQFELAVRGIHGDAAGVASLLVGVDTDTDAIRVHVPGAGGDMAVARYVDNVGLYERTRGLPREEAKDLIRAEVARCAGVAGADGASEGMRWLCGYLLKNNLGQQDAVRAWHGGRYPDQDHTERLIVVGDAIDAVQLRNLAFQAQIDTVEEGARDLDVGIEILRQLHEPRGLGVPILAHASYREDLPGAFERAQQRAQRLRAAIESRHADLAARGILQVHPVALPLESTAFAAAAGTATGRTSVAQENRP